MWLSYGFQVVESVIECDVVQFTGGSDVSPGFYRAREHPMSACDFHRDNKELDVYIDAKRLGKPCVGICRGGQFLNVLNGGSLYQHVDRHDTGEHMAHCKLSGVDLLVSSTHHQMMVPNLATGQIIMDASEATFKEVSASKYLSSSYQSVVDCNKLSGVEKTKDAEVVFYPSTKDLCFQPHPEFHGFEHCKSYFFSLLGVLKMFEGVNKCVV